MNDAQSDAIAGHERRAQSWDRWVTILIVLFLFIPLPFARFESWPGGQILANHIITPWSRFRVCYASYPEGNPMEEAYEFTWNARIVPGNSTPLLLRMPSIAPPLLKWQNGPEVELTEPFYKGELVRVKTAWQPIVLWPFQLGARIFPKG